MPITSKRIIRDEQICCIELEMQAEILSMLVTRPCFEEEYKFERLT